MVPNMQSHLLVIAVTMRNETTAASQGECLAVIWAVQYFRQFLFGKPFTLITDHAPLKWIMTTTKFTGKLARWALLLQEYEFEVIYRCCKLQCRRVQSLSITRDSH